MLRKRLKRAALALLGETPEERIERDWARILLDVAALKEELREAVAGRSVLAGEVERLDGVELALEEKQRELDATTGRLTREEERAQIWRERADALGLDVRRLKGDHERLKEELERVRAIPSADLASAVGALYEVERLCSARLPPRGSMMVDDGKGFDAGALAMFAREVRNVATRGMRSAVDANLRRSGLSALQLALEAHADRVLRALMRHRERYLRAWVARTGIDPRDAELVEDLREPGVTVITVRVRKEAVHTKRFLEGTTQASGEELDAIAAGVGLERRTGQRDDGWGAGPERETDVELRQRVIATVSGKVN